MPARWLVNCLVNWLMPAWLILFNYVLHYLFCSRLFCSALFCSFSILFCFLVSCGLVCLLAPSCECFLNWFWGFGKLLCLFKCSFFGAFVSLCDRVRVGCRMRCCAVSFFVVLCACSVACRSIDLFVCVLGWLPPCVSAGLLTCLFAWLLVCVRCLRACFSV